MLDINIEMDGETLKSLVYNYLADQLGNLPLDRKKVRILVKSSQNYRAEWEEGKFKAIYISKV